MSRSARWSMTSSKFCAWETNGTDFLLEANLERARSVYPAQYRPWKCRYRDTLRGARLRYCLPVSDCAGPRSRGVVAGSFDINDAVEPVNPVREPIRQAVLRYPIVEFGRGAQATRGLKPSQCPA